jgi:hypothetical protein
MIASVLHDREGKIIAIAAKQDPASAGSKFSSYGLVAQSGQLIAEIDLGAEHASRSLRELHDLFRVDLTSLTLVKK